jgi:tetratricopeptide (TPR) repeat protein
MLHRCLTPIIGVTAVMLPLAATSLAPAQTISDRVRLTRGSETGEVAKMTPHEVTVTKGSADSRTIAVNEIRSIVFDGEPPELSQARINAQNGGYKNALVALEKIDVNAVRRDFIKQDIEFYAAWCAAKMALAGDGQIGEAGRQLNSFVRSHPQNFHYLAAMETMGDLLMAGERYDLAQKQYAELTRTPWPDYKMRAAVAIGRSLQAQGKHAEAIGQFDAALAVSDESAQSQNQRLEATLGKAVSLADTGKVDEAVEIIERVIYDADPQQKELHARAYNALGNCYRKANKMKDALLAYLHVDVLYANVPEAHAEALANLAPLWQAVGQEERAREARELLEERYAGSRWSKPSP